MSDPAVARPRYLFASYAREDAERVDPVIRAVDRALRRRGLPVEVWLDRAQLQPGDVWARTIEDGLSASVGLLLFASEASLRSRWVSSELDAVAMRAGKLVIPILLDAGLQLPLMLTARQWIDLTAGLAPADVEHAAERIAQATARQLADPHPPAPIAPHDAPQVAHDLAQAARGRPPDAAAGDVPRSVFVVHGHDTAALSQVCGFLARHAIEAIVLAQAEGAGAESLLQKFLRHGARSRFAVVLLSADDYGASRLQYDAAGVRERALQYRARQNVLLELGFFYGHLGWEHVFVLVCQSPSVFPNFERPSDLDGLIFDAFDDAGRWSGALAARLTRAGFEIESPT